MKMIFFSFLCVLLLARALQAAPTAYEKLVVPEHGAYTGAYVDFGEGEDGVTLEAIEDFEKLVKKHQAIIAFGSFWARQQFPTAQVNLVRSYGAVPFLYWSPWDTPFDNGEKHGPDKFALDKILNGTWDHYIDTWADGAKAVPSQFFVAFGCEMNGTWFPWSGYFYGKGKLLNRKKTEPILYAGPEKYKQAYRYVVDRVRARGATNILWVFQVNNYSYPNARWNLAAAYYPGSNYVDWLGMSLYGKQYAKEDWDLFEPLLEWPYQELCNLDPQKPIMLAEWGVAEPHQSELKGTWFRDAFQVMTEKKYPYLFNSLDSRTVRPSSELPRSSEEGQPLREKLVEKRPAQMAGKRPAQMAEERPEKLSSEVNGYKYPRLKAAVVWHERWANADGTFSNLRINSSRSSLKAYQEGVASPFWIDRPVWSKISK